MSERLEKALKLQQEDKLDEAQVIFEACLEDNPNDHDALHGLGLLFAQQKDFAKAVDWLQKAVEVAPHVPGFHNNLANALKACHRINEAMTHYRHALRLKSPYPQAHNNLAKLLMMQGQNQEAIEHLKKAIREDAHYLDAHYNLANLYASEGQLMSAKPHYEKVLDLYPEHLGAMHNLGISFTALKDFARAKPLLEKAVQREPHNLDALFHLGIIYASEQNIDEAMHYYEKTLQLDPNHHNATHNIATLYLHQKQKDKALIFYEKALELNPDNRTAKHMIQALSGKANLEGAPEEYVRALFDQYAYSYNQHMGQTLEYQVPSLLRQAFAPTAQELNTVIKVLDLGCGTGLIAPHFRDIADTITGVDLSSNMIEVAHAQGGYDKLIVSDIKTYLTTTKLSYDLIICADVLVYFGELKTLFEAIKERLTPKGMVVFSIENTDTTNEFELSETGRYRHHPESVKAMIEALGFESLFDQTCPIRKQEDVDVLGTLMGFRLND